MPVADSDGGSPTACWLAAELARSGRALQDEVVAFCTMSAAAPATEDRGASPAGHVRAWLQVPLHATLILTLQMLGNGQCSCLALCSAQIVQVSQVTHNLRHPTLSR